MKVKVTAPGRINLIGEHTDYNEGFVLPVAIDYAVTVEATAVAEQHITAVSEGFGYADRFSPGGLPKPPGHPRWSDYLKGVCWAFERAGYHVKGARLAISSSVPVGAGLSSSAAFEVAVAAALAYLSGLRLEPSRLALLCRQAENEYVGVRCGAMDQFAAALSRSGSALLLDCRTLDYQHIPLPLEQGRLLIVDSRVSRNLVVSEYNRRREECEAAVIQLAKLLGRPLRSLRDVSGAEIGSVEGRLPALLARRSRYVVEENSRVLAAVEALRAGDLQGFGRLMGLSHAGLRDLYEVSCPELDLIVETAAGCPEVFGARMTGAGFGGCAVILLKQEAVEEVKQRLCETFNRRGWPEPYFHLTSAATGLTVFPNGC